VSFPAYNEAPYIGDLVSKAKQYASEVIVVDDGSADFTGSIARDNGATVVTHKVNMGYGVAIKSIFAEAKQRIGKFDVLIILDADSQHEPNEIPCMAHPILEGYDVVIGHRNQKQIPAYRVAGQKVLSKFTSVLSDVSLDSQSGFRSYSPKAVEMLHPKENGMAISSELVSLATECKLKITEVPISVKYFEDGSTENPISQGTSTLMKIIRMISERKPLLFFGLGGFILTILGLVLGVKSYLMLIEHAGALPIGTALVSFLLMSVGVFSMFTGIILNVVGKIKV
jgi:glycosyltransferase involved in cell wall biosynthesis